ncbi:hypothetical protein AB4Y30_01405 [Ornithinibacillus sp. 4-3]|uniref:Uncharacterized protein n=1 Tax=Ornithinibacillus sp. 4-3 TaxID=3231488 RepID=A0AB39HTF8_9BACI
MSLKDKLNNKSNEKIKEAAKSLAKIMEPKLIKSAEKGYQSLSINLEDNPDYMEPYLIFTGVEKFKQELSRCLDNISIRLEQKPKYFGVFRKKQLVSYTPYLIFDWRHKQ